MTKILLLFLSFTSCQTFSPLRETVATPTTFGTIDAVVPQWEPYAEEFGGGLALFAGKTENPRLEFWVLRADLSEPRLSIVVSDPGTGEGAYQENHIPAASVSHFVEHSNCVAGINTNPFSPSSAKIGEDRFIDGITVSNGIIVARPDPRYDALVFYADHAVEKGDDAFSTQRMAAIVSQRELANMHGIANAVGGFQMVLRDGALVKRVLDQAADEKAPRYPRSAAGLSASGNILYLLAIDGRRSSSIGATEAELGLLLQRIGACDGLNFDGGGSTAMVLRTLRPEKENPYGKTVLANVPIHNRIPGWERAVASCLGIRLGKE
ncbi:MAG: phosphodiester glycosidase family protein [Treponema sp.]|nr:phosphodiester glycosidase family protein [Treponema sp.]